MSDGTSLLNSVIAQFDAAAAYCDIEPGLLEQLRRNAVYHMRFPSSAMTVRSP